MTMCVTMTIVKSEPKNIPIHLVRCGLAPKVRRRYMSGVVRRCIDSSSAIKESESARKEHQV